MGPSGGGDRQVASGDRRRGPRSSPRGEARTWNLGQSLAVLAWAEAVNSGDAAEVGALLGQSFHALPGDQQCRRGRKCIITRAGAWSALGKTEESASQFERGGEPGSPWQPTGDWQRLRRHAGGARYRSGYRRYFFAKPVESERTCMQGGAADVGSGFHPAAGFLAGVSSSVAKRRAEARRRGLKILTPLLCREPAMRRVAAAAPTPGVPVCGRRGFTLLEMLVATPGFMGIAVVSAAGEHLSVVAQRRDICTDYDRGRAARPGRRWTQLASRP